MPSDRVTNLPVLLYHYIDERTDVYPQLTISVRQFKRQMLWLRRHGYTGVTAHDGLAWLRGELICRRPVVLTFDDGNASVATNALPLLQELNFRATLFVITGSVGKRHYMDVSQVRDWVARGMEFGSHSRTHRELCTLTNAELDEELGGSAVDLQAITGRLPEVFAYPYGHYNSEVQARVRRWYRAAFSCEPQADDQSRDLYGLRRIAIDQDRILMDLRRTLAGKPLRFAALRHRAQVRTRLRKYMRALRRDEPFAAPPHAALVVSSITEVQQRGKAS